MSGTVDVTVLASGSGTNLQAVIDRLHGSDLKPVRVGHVIGSRPGIGALERAKRHGIPSSVLPEAGADEWLLRTLEEDRPGLVVLAGWLKLVSTPVVRAWRGRMINIHPALLPSFGGCGMYGRRVHEAVVASGVRVSGPTVHFVDEIYDHGAIVAQWPVPVLEADDADSLAARVLRAEHRLLPAVIEAFAAGRFRLGAEGAVEWTEPWFEADEFTMQGRFISD